MGGSSPSGATGRCHGLVGEAHAGAHLGEVADESRAREPGVLRGGARAADERARLCLRGVLGELGPDRREQSRESLLVAVRLLELSGQLLQGRRRALRVTVAGVCRRGGGGTAQHGGGRFVDGARVLGVADQRQDAERADGD